MEWGDAATWFSGAVTSVAVFFAAVQVRQLRRDGQRRDRAELEGVVVSWRALDVPTAADGEGNSTSTYEIVAHNPGALPITDVSVTLTSGCLLTRVHYDGSQEPPSNVITVDTPVIPEGANRVWQRRLRVCYDEREMLRDLEASIRFYSVLDRRRHTNRWGRRAHGLDSAHVAAPQTEKTVEKSVRVDP
jgi:hypothetical protein